MDDWMNYIIDRPVFLFFPLVPFFFPCNGTAEQCTNERCTEEKEDQQAFKVLHDLVKNHNGSTLVWPPALSSYVFFICKCICYVDSPWWLKCGQLQFTAGGLQLYTELCKERLNQPKQTIKHYKTPQKQSCCQVSNSNYVIHLISFLRIPYSSYLLF